MNIVADQTPEVSAWVAQRIPDMQRGFGPCAAIGIAEGNTPIAGFVFHDYHAWPGGDGVMQFSLASDSPRWLRQRKMFARTILFYPFYTAKVWKLWTAIPHTSERTLKLGHTFGFTREAMLVDQLGRKKHAFISRMFRKDYDRIYGAQVEQKRHTATADAA